MYLRMRVYVAAVTKSAGVLAIGFFLASVGCSQPVLHNTDDVNTDTAANCGDRAVADAAFSETDLSDDLKRIAVPTLILHGDHDQIVPIAASALPAAKLVKNATLKIHPRAPHGLCTTMKNEINEDLLAFIRA